MFTNSETLKDQVVRLFGKGLTNEQITTKLDCDIRTVRAYLTQLGFKSNRYEVIDIDSKLEQFLLASYLGDGSYLVSSKASTNAYLQIAHSQKQQEYCYWKYEFLKDYNLVNSISNSTIVSDRYKEGGFKETRFKTKTHPIFTNIRQNCYNFDTGKKLFNKDYIEKIESFALAIWYMDDGFVTNDSCQISTTKFSIDEVNILREVLKRKFSLETSINVDRELYIKAQSYKDFKNIVSPFILPSLEYKLKNYTERIKES